MTGLEWFLHRQLVTLRNELSALRPEPAEHDLGFRRSLARLCACIERRSGVACRLSIGGARFFLDGEFGEALFRITQETLLFLVRTPGLRRLGAALRWQDGEVRLQVSGVSPEQVAIAELPAALCHAVGAYGGRFEIDRTGVLTVAFPCDAIDEVPHSFRISA